MCAVERSKHIAMIYTAAAAADYAAAAAIFSFCEKHGSFNGNERSGSELKTFDDQLFWRDEYEMDKRRNFFFPPLFISIGYRPAKKGTEEQFVSREGPTRGTLSPHTRKYTCV